MENNARGLAAAATLVGVGALAWSAGWLERFVDKSHGAIASCEAHLINSLVSPSSYVRANAEYLPKPPLTFDEGFAMRAAKTRGQYPTADALTAAYERAVERDGPTFARMKKRGERLTEEQASMLRLWQYAQDQRAGDDERLRKNLPQDRTAVVVIEYDADNQVGANIRSSSFCRFDARTDARSYAENDILQFGPLEDYEQTTGELMVTAGQIEFRDLD